MMEALTVIPSKYDRGREGNGIIASCKELFTRPTGKDLEQVLQGRYGFLGRKGILYQTFASGILEIFTQ